IYSSIVFTGRRPPLPEAARPTKTVRGDGSMQFAGEQIDYGYKTAPHSDAVLFLPFPKLNLLAVGGVVLAEEWPLLDYRDGAWLGGRVRAVERLADLLQPPPPRGRAT